MLKLPVWRPVGVRPPVAPGGASAAAEPSGLSKYVQATWTVSVAGLPAVAVPVTVIRPEWSASTSKPAPSAGEVTLLAVTAAPAAGAKTRAATTRATPPPPANPHGLDVHR